MPRKCQHEKQKHQCRECSPSYFCEHDRLKYTCKECGGYSICKHGKHKQVCRECGGSSICKHGKYKRYCKECSGSVFCTHGISKYYCKECGGSQICKHEKFKQVCIECGGSSFCKHGKQKQSCKECGGSAFCKHNIQKQYCKECGGSQLCKSEWCSTAKNPKYDGYCWFCYVNMFPDKPVARNFKTKERAVVDYVKSQFEFEWICDRRVAEGCSLRRPDLLLHLGDQVIVVECDENQHTDYDCSCENKRLMEISQDVDHVPLVFIRFNPDDYTKDGVKTTSCWNDGKIKKSKEKEWKERLEVLKTQIQYWIDNRTPKTVEIVQLFYD